MGNKFRGHPQRRMQGEIQRLTAITGDRKIPDRQGSLPFSGVIHPRRRSEAQPRPAAGAGAKPGRRRRPRAREGWGGPTETGRARRKPSFSPAVRRVGRPRGGRARANASAGVRWPGALRGRAFRMSRTRFTRASVTSRRSVPFGRYRDGGPLVCPFRPRSHEWWGVGRRKPAASAFASFACPAVSLPLPAVIVWTLAPGPSGRSVIAPPTAPALFPSTLWTGGCSDARSTGDTTAPPWPLPITVSASRSPVPAFAPTSFGRSGMSLRPGIWPPARVAATLPVPLPSAAAEVRQRTSATLPVGPDAVVYPLPADHAGVLQPETTRDPFRAPALLQLRHDRRPALPVGFPRHRRGTAPPPGGPPLRPPAPVSPTAGVATELTRYVGGSRPGRRAMAPFESPPFPRAKIRRLPSKVG